MEHFDALVIGAGQSGGPLAGAFARAGFRTALVERAHIGGTCINEGCTPTKTMVASARVAYLARRAADYGVHTGAVTVDLSEVRARKRGIVASFRQGSERRLDDAGVDVIAGEARFVAHRMIAVELLAGGETTMTADRIFINTGERPAQPRLPGIDAVPVLNSTSVMELDRLPEHLVVLGGGYIGLEFGQMFRRFGSEVTIVQRGGQLLPREDADVAEAVAEILREDGINVLLDTDAVSVERAAGDAVNLTVRSAGQELVVKGSHLLTAVGRMPNTERLNLSAAGVATDGRGYIRVNGKLETTAPGVYALGDVKGPPAFTHISYDDFRILRTNLLENGDASTDDRLVPYTVFIDPQLGRIGLSETDARMIGREVWIAKMPMSHVARALEMDESRGFMKVLIDPDTERLLGAAVLGVEGGELMSALSLAMMGNLRFTTLRDAVFAHPTLAEAFNNLFTTVKTTTSKATT